MKSGRENLSGLRVEAVRGQHPDVAKAIVVGLPHVGEAVTSAVVLRDGGSAMEEDLIKHGRRVFAGYPTPSGVLFFGDLPQTVGGKVLKYRLRAPRNMYGGIEADI